MKNILLVSFSIIVFVIVAAAQNPVNLSVGDKAPDFKTLADNGSTWDVSDYIGTKYIVVYFYPAAMTGGCTKQACAYRDMKSDIKSANALVVGISGDSVEGLKLFKKAEDLNFTLLSDESGEIANKFGVPSRDGGSITREIDGATYDLVRGNTASRWTFIIDKNGKIAYKNDEVNATKDSEEVLKFLNEKS